MTGVALDPNFASNHRVFVFYCLGSATAEHCRVERLIENGTTATSDKVLLDFPTVNRDHIGGRLKVGPDGMLYLTTGGQDNTALAQDPTSYAGKILKMDLDGNAMGAGLANPYVYTLGHRDPQGRAWDSSGALYESEHGPVSNDEINLIEAGKNYGWPTCVGRCNNSAFVDPVKLWSPETAAPSGITFYTSTVIPQWTGNLFVALLGHADNTYAQHLHRMAISGTTVTAEEALFKGKYGRIRDVTQGPDGFLYFSTSNGSGTDVIVRVKPQ